LRLHGEAHSRWLLPLFLLVALLAVLPPLACASSGEGTGGRAVFDLTMRIVNFVILVGVIVYFTRKPIVNGIRNSIESVRSMLKDAEESRLAAESRMKEAEERLARVDSEVAELLESARKEGEVERERILAETAEAVEKIRKDTALAMEQEVKKSRETLKKDAAEAAVALAENIIREKVTPEDHRDFIADYLEKLEADQ
jgi:F-type H+-transporting ATPase subunit b